MNPMKQDTASTARHCSGNIGCIRPNFDKKLHFDTLMSKLQHKHDETGHSDPHRCGANRGHRHRDSRRSRGGRGDRLLLNNMQYEILRAVGAASSRACGGKQARACAGRLPKPGRAVEGNDAASRAAIAAAVRARGRGADMSQPTML